MKLSSKGHAQQYRVPLLSESVVANNASDCLDGCGIMLRSGATERQSLRTTGRLTPSVASFRAVLRLLPIIAVDDMGIIEKCWLVRPKLRVCKLEPHNDPLKDGASVIVYRRTPGKPESL